MNDNPTKSETALLVQVVHACRGQDESVQYGIVGKAIIAKREAVLLEFEQLAERLRDSGATDDEAADEIATVVARLRAWQ